jgi:hypothetical protein
MSADNGIYIASFKDGYRVIYAQAIDNLWYFPENVDEYTAKNIVCEEWRKYWQDSEVYASFELAMQVAHRMVKHYTSPPGHMSWVDIEGSYKRTVVPVLEYGIIHLGQGIEWDEQQSMSDIREQLRCVEACFKVRNTWHDWRSAIEGRPRAEAAGAPMTLHHLAAQMAEQRAKVQHIDQRLADLRLEMTQLQESQHRDKQFPA